MTTQKRTRRTKEQIAADNAAAEQDVSRSRSNGRGEREEIRQKPQKPLKLDASIVKRQLQEQLGKELKLKWVRHQAVTHHQEIGWEVVNADMKTKVNRYTPDGRLKAKSEDIQSQEGGAYTAEVGNGEFNFLMYKDLERYNAEDAVWNKEEADRPMDSIQEASVMGARAGMGEGVTAYQPKNEVKISKKRDAY